MLNFLSLLDFYGSNFSFTLDKKKKFTTSFGGILTIITMILLVVLFFILGDEMINRKNPKSSISQYLAKQQPQVNLSEYNLEIGIKIAQLNNDKTENLLNFTGDYLYSEVIYETDYFNETETQREDLKSELRNCTNENFLQTVDKADSYICFNLNESFGGTLGQTINSTSLNLYIANCKYNAPYGSPFIKCNSVLNLTNTFKKYNTNPYMLIVQYPKFYYDPWNKNQPVTIEYQTLSFPFDHNLQRIDKLYFHNNIVNEDKGWWFERIEKQSYWTVESLTHFYNYKANDDLQIRYSSSILYTLSFEMSFDTTSYSRSYMKFMEVLAVVTSMIKIVAIAFEVCSLFVNSCFFQVYLLKLFFDVSPSSTSPTTLNLKTTSDKSFITTMNATSANFLIQTKSKPTLTNNFTKNIKTPPPPKKPKQGILSEKHNTKVRFSYCFAVRRTLSVVTKSENPKVKLYDFGIDLIQKEIELSKYVKTLYDMMIIKKALFNKEQLELLMGVKRPSLFKYQEIDDIYGLNLQRKSATVSQMVELFSSINNNKKQMSSFFQATKCSQQLAKSVQQFISAEDNNDNSLK